MAYTIKQFETADGPLILAFDFIPEEPTTAQLGEFVPHNCSTCEGIPRADGCGIAPQNTRRTEQCSNWKIGPAAFAVANVEYYKDLHEKHYGKT